MCFFIAASLTHSNSNLYLSLNFISLYASFLVICISLSLCTCFYRGVYTFLFLLRISIAKKHRKNNVRILNSATFFEAFFFGNFLELQKSYFFLVARPLKKNSCFAASLSNLLCSYGTDDKWKGRHRREFSEGLKSKPSIQSNSILNIYLSNLYLYSFLTFSPSSILYLFFLFHFLILKTGCCYWVSQK